MAIVRRWVEQTGQGIVWRDVGLGDRRVDFDDQDDNQRPGPPVLAIAKEPAAALAKVGKARVFVRHRGMKR